MIDRVLESAKIRKIISRAEEKVGTALREFIAEEVQRPDYELGAFSTALQYVISDEVSKHVLRECKKGMRAEMKESYTALVVTCLTVCFDFRIGDSDGRKIADVQPSNGRRSKINQR
jgi:hypothetical protein